MKKIVRIMYVLLISGLVLSLSGCKTKEKVSENYTENIQANSTETKKEMCFSDRHERECTAEQTQQTAEMDSLVEKFWERVVTDSCGRILFKDSEYTKEHYQGRGAVKTNNRGSEARTVKEQSNNQLRAKTDSSGVTTRESAEKTTKQTYRWLWFPGLLMLLIACGSVISRITR